MLLVQLHIDIKWTIKVLQQVMLGIFLREDGMLGWYLPIDAESIIEDADTTISLWVIEVITLVLEDCCF